MTQPSGLPPILELRGIHQSYFDDKKQQDFVVFNASLL
jgi:NitT/TauT family transport system ATP-binding protein